MKIRWESFTGVKELDLGSEEGYRYLVDFVALDDDTAAEVVEALQESEDGIVFLGSQESYKERLVLTEHGPVFEPVQFWLTEKGSGAQVAGPYSRFEDAAHDRSGTDLRIVSVYT